MLTEIHKKRGEGQVKKICNWFIHNASMQKKLIISYIILVSIPLCILGIHSFSAANQNLLDQTEVTMDNNLHRMCQEADAIFQRETDFTKYLAYNLEFRQTLEGNAYNGSAIAQSLNKTVEPVFWYFITSDENLKMLIGGDFHEGCQYVPPVMAALAQVKTPLGTYAVLGNNDYEACYDDIVREMRHYGMHLLEHKVDTLRRGGERILVAGVRNPFDLGKNGTSPTLGLSPDDFVILLTHTPDYAEDVPVTNSDLILAGHTHGGQVTLFGLYAPIVPSHYGQRFLSGLKYNSKNIPMIVTNGIGTSQKAIRMFAPAEVVMIVLHRLTD